MVVSHGGGAGPAGLISTQPKGISGAAGGGMTAVVGGRERAVGTWGGYEIDRRAAAGGSETVYVGRGFIGGLDAAASLLKAARLNHGDRDGEAVPHSAAAIQGLVEVIQARELDATKQDWWDTHEHVSLSSAELRTVAAKIKEEGFATLEDLQEGVDAADFVVETYLGKAEGVAGLKSQGAAAAQAVDAARAPRKTLQEHDYVVIGDGAGAVAALEEKSRPYVEAAEKSEALVAAYIERVTATLKAASGAEALPPRKTLQEHDYVVLSNKAGAAAVPEEKSRPHTGAAEKSEDSVAAYVKRVSVALKTAVADA